jgi:ribonuclease P protein component
LPFVLANQTFHKTERLGSKKHIARLYSEPTGSFFLYPVKFVYLIAPMREEVPAQVLISVPKRNFKKAHDRNRIKRQLREIYRKNKSILYDSLISNKQQACFLIGYVGKEHITSELLEQKLVPLFKKFAHAVAENNT